METVFGYFKALGGQWVQFERMLSSMYPKCDEQIEIEMAIEAPT